VSAAVCGANRKAAVIAAFGTASTFLRTQPTQQVATYLSPSPCDGALHSRRRGGGPAPVHDPLRASIPRRKPSRLSMAWRRWWARPSSSWTSFWSTYFRH